MRLAACLHRMPNAYFQVDKGRLFPVTPMRTKPDNAAVLARLITRALELLLATMFVVGLWMLADVNVASATKAADRSVFVQVGRSEPLMVLILLLLNVLMAYAVFVRFKAAGKTIRTSLGIIIASLLALCVWIGLRFLPREIIMPDATDYHGRINGSEIVLAVILVLSSILGVLVMLRRFMRAKQFLVISAYSKKVNYKGEWITIEEYLQRELGVEVSHGMTPDESREVMDDFHRRRALAGIPGPPPPETKPDVQAEKPVVPEKPTK